MGIHQGGFGQVRAGFEDRMRELMFYQTLDLLREALLLIAVQYFAGSWANFSLGLLLSQ